MIMIKNDCQRGFTIIELVVAIFILMVGILGAIIMQNTSIGGNSTAIHLTEAANSASDRMEILMAMDYDDASLSDTNDSGANAGVTGLDNTDIVGSEADLGPVTQGNFTLFWNVAEDYPIFGAKTIRVIVRRTDGSARDTVIDFTKMEPI